MSTSHAEQRLAHPMAAATASRVGVRLIVTHFGFGGRRIGAIDDTEPPS